MSSSQWHFSPKVGVEGELMLKKNLSSKIFERETAYLFTAQCFALPRAQSSHGLNLLVMSMPRALGVAQVMVSDGWPHSTWRSLIFLFVRVVADTALSLLALHRKSTPATQLSWVLIWGSRMLLPVGVLTTMMFWWSLANLFPCKNLHIRENRFAHALGQNFTGHRVWNHSVPLTWHTLTQSLPFFIAGIIPELPWIDSSMRKTSYKPVSLLMTWRDAPESPIQVFFVNKKMCHHQWCTSYQPPKAV